MGVNISDIITREKAAIADFSGRWIAVDAYNILYQFLSIIRQPDGTPLIDSRGNVTSHLAGLLSRTTSLLSAGINLAFVYDGEPHALKAKTLRGRRARKEKARAEWEAALEEGDLETARTKAQQTSVLTHDMVEETKALIGFLGIPWVEAPSDGEAQASYMAGRGDVWGCASQDFDSLLFGADNLIRNLTLTGRRKMPKRKAYITVEPEVVNLEDTLSALEITREQLIDVAILVGTDFNDGIKGIGPKKGLKLMQKHGNLEAVFAEKDITIENYQDVRDIFLSPCVTDDYVVKKHGMNLSGALRLLVDEHDFSEERVKSALGKIKEERESEAQMSLDRWT
jgi:flap endonuclease-1